MRKVTTMLMLLLCAVCAVCAVACNNTPSEPKGTITLSSYETTVDMFTDVNLTARTENITDAVVWSSSDETVATVTDGKVVAKKAGAVKITASAGEVSASCNVTFTAYTGALYACTEYATISLKEGESRTVTAFAKLANEAEVTADVFNFTSANPAVATVNTAGEIVGVSKGNTTVTVSGTAKGLTLTETSVAVEVKEDLTLSVTNPADSRKEIYIVSGANDEETQFTVSAEALSGGGTVSGGAYTLTANTDGIVTIENLTVKAKAVGETVITVKYVSEKGTELTNDIYVTVKKLPVDLSANGAVTFSLANATDISDLNIGGDVKKVYVNGQECTFTLSSNKLLLTGESLETGSGITVKLETDTQIVQITADIFDYTISTADEFIAYLNASADYAKKSAVLTADIDCAGKTIPCGIYYGGTIDGRGHTVYNVNISNRLFEAVDGATIKNIAFVNVVRTGGGGGVLINDAYSGNDSHVENVFIQGVHNGQSTLIGGLVGTGNTLIVKNTVLVLEFANPVAEQGALVAGGVKEMENAYVISSTSSGILVDGGTSDGVYLNAAAFKTKAQELSSVFDSNYWTVEGGLLVFKSAVDVIKGIYPVQTTIEITNSQTTVLDGQSVVLTSNVDGASFSIKDAVNGVTLNNNTLKIDGITQDCSVTVVAKWAHPVFDYALETEKTFGLVKPEIISLNPVIIGANRSSDGLELNLGEYNLETVSVIVNGTEFTAYTYASGKLTATFDALTRGRKEITVTGSSDKLYLISVVVEVADYAVGTVAEFNAWAKYVQANGFTNMRMILTADIDYTGNDFNAACEGDALSRNIANCEIDGRGYSIKNFGSSTGMFYSVTGVTLKNIAFTNINVHSNWGFFGRSISSMTIENVYVQGNLDLLATHTNTENYASDGVGVFGYAGDALTTGKNFLLKVEMSGGKFDEGTAFRYAVCGFGLQNVTNTYVLSTTSNGGCATWLDSPTSGKIYTDTDAYKADVNAIYQAFDSDYWEIQDGDLVLVHVD